MTSLKKYKIKKGKHDAGFDFAPFYGKTVSKYEVIFTSSCIYDLHDEDQYDINKLFGLSYLYHHNNSARFGWRSTGDRIEISAYCYINGKRYFEDICLIETGRMYSMELRNTGDYYEFKVANSEGILNLCLKIKKPKTSKLGYKLFPYFGGNKTAPHDMKILMRKIK